MPAGPRIRSNNQFGLTTDNPLTAGATTFNSARLSLFPVVSAAHAVVTLDPRALNGEPEIVIITAHTAAATVATITRGAYGTVARSHPSGTEWVHAPLDEDVIEILTSGTRPSDPYRGQAIFETDTNRYVGRSTADAWQDINLFSDAPACRVFHNTTQSIPDATETTVVFNSEYYDNDNMHSTAANTGRITFNTAGVYWITSNIRLASGTDYSQVYIAIRADGTTEIAIQLLTPTAFNTVQCLELTTVHKFAVGQFIELRIWHDNTANAARNVLNNQQSSPIFGATWVSRG